MSTKEFSNSFSLTDEIADIVRERILKGEYEIGEKIKENQIASELRVSRTPIREAFKLLENEGLIDYIPNRGCFAKGFTKQDVEDIYAVREALEEMAVRWAVARISENEIDEMEEQCDLMEFYTRKKDKKKVMEMNTSFHEVIYASAKSRFWRRCCVPTRTISTKPVNRFFMSNPIWRQFYRSIVQSWRESARETKRKQWQRWLGTWNARRLGPRLSGI